MISRPRSVDIYFENCKRNIFDINKQIGSIRTNVEIMKIKNRHDELNQLSEELMNLKNRIDDVIQDILP